MAVRERPLSPHLQIYRPQITSVLSILHRLTGVALGVGTIVLVWWLVAAAVGPDAFEGAQGFLGSIFGQLILFGWSWALFYHLCNGIRHLAWDIGWGFELPTVAATGWTVVAASGAMTVFAWILGLALGG